MISLEGKVGSAKGTGMPIREGGRKQEGSHLCCGEGKGRELIARAPFTHGRKEEEEGSDHKEVIHLICFEGKRISPPPRKKKRECKWCSSTPRRDAPFFKKESLGGHRKGVRELRAMSERKRRKGGGRLDSVWEVDVIPNLFSKGDTDNKNLSREASARSRRTSRQLRGEGDKTSS